MGFESRTSRLRDVYSNSKFLTNSLKPPPPPPPISPIINATVIIMTMDIYDFIDRNGQNADELLPTQADSSRPYTRLQLVCSTVYHHFIFTYFRVLQVKLSCRLVVNWALKTNGVPAIYCRILNTTVYM